MESTGLEGKIQVSPSTYEKLQGQYTFEERGVQEVKGKGKMITYLFKDRAYVRTISGNYRRRPTLTPPHGLKKHPEKISSVGTENGEPHPNGSETFRKIERESKVELLSAPGEVNRPKEEIPMGITQTDSLQYELFTKTVQENKP